MATTNENKPNEKKAATPAEISKATADVSAALSGFSHDEQHRIIRAAAAINGLKNQAKK